MKKLTLGSVLMLGTAILLLDTELGVAQDEKPAVNRRVKVRPGAPTQPDKEASEDDTPAEPGKGTNRVDKATDPEELLTDKGLIKDNRKFLLDEAAALEKFGQTKTVYSDFQKAMEKFLTIAQYDEELASLDMQSQMMQQEANALQQQINNTSAMAARSRVNANAQLAAMRQQQSLATAQVNQLRSQVAAMQGNAPKPAERESVAAELEKTRQAYVEAVHELAEHVTPLMQQYQELARDKPVTEALEQLRRKTTRNYRLGPSDELRSAAKVIKDLKLNTAAPARTRAGGKKKAATKGSP